LYSVEFVVTFAVREFSVFFTSCLLVIIELFGYMNDTQKLMVLFNPGMKKMMH